MSLEKLNIPMINNYSPALVVGLGSTFLCLCISLYFRQKVRRLRRSPPVLSGASASAGPAVALQLAAKHMARGDIATLGELVFFLRGDFPRRLIVDRALRALLLRVVDPAASSTPPPSAAASSASSPSPSAPAPAASPPPSAPASRSPSPSASAPASVSSAPAASAVLASLEPSPRLLPMLRGLCDCTERASRLRAERATAFDADCAAHVGLLRTLWAAAGKPPEGFAQRSKEWSSMGFQGLDPTTDLRGGGVLALRVFAHFVQTHKEEFFAMVEYNRAVLAAGEDCWYLPAVVSIQFTAQILLQGYDLYLPQLEILYDTVHDGDDRARARTAIATRHGDEHKLKALWAQESDFEKGFFTLHHQLLLHFKHCWHRDRPHVMKYGVYINTVLKSFFTPDE